MLNRSLAKQLGSIFAILCLLLVLPAAAVAECGPHGAKHAECTGAGSAEHAACGDAHGAGLGCLSDSDGMGGCHAQMFKNLNLTDEQQASIDKIHADLKPDYAGKRAEAEMLHAKLAELIHALDYDASAIQQVAEDMAAMQAEKIVAKAGMMNQVLQLLTPEQLENLEGLKGQCAGGKAHGAPAHKRPFGHGHGGGHKN